MLTLSYPHASIGVSVTGRLAPPKPAPKFPGALQRPRRKDKGVTYDLLIKNGRIIDGSGTGSFIGDVAVRDGLIALVCKADAGAKRVIDAEGLAVAPGFIDGHTHYDAQIFWDPLLTSTCW